MTEDKLGAKFWKAFEQTTFTDDENSDEQETEEDVTTSNMDESDENEENESMTGIDDTDLTGCYYEKADGEHVGFDGESDRSEEEEEMDEDDLNFLDDEKTDDEAGPSGLALLNSARFEDDDKLLKRL